MKRYIRFQQVIAEECDLKTYEAKTGKNPLADKGEKGNLPGYTVINENGFSRWVEKNSFEKTFAPAETPKEREENELIELLQRIENFTKQLEEKPNDRLMMAQLSSMQTYASVLSLRIDKL